ncbi:MAG: hypothetical protein CLLPBCKN_007490 [Chroococcidiopsis cubana SAG 39.79]|uniref:Uncharacterized protein n=1 Tax=Chroococcidiopsis cubana SAG 39.79 TaxID=388085 RepID=A0AB37UTG0_9CYAN|nr:hypothetical protein [Chroococcidiopsis cubana]MDZ4878055.1 hypothetical protein [Chroococcidiopsis cubana SAG 39.79]PSB66520.1 hypothetical protein C7B79_00765 [Chroococcidiopsis cubana CCALA 043]RUT14663.1 hypothetical protein DSM107010_02090 [Chroococcidiopsis cubana SAG 39.79]
MSYQRQHDPISLNSLSTKQALFVAFATSTFLLVAGYRLPLVSILLFALPLGFLLMSLPLSIQSCKKKPVKNHLPLMLPPADR